MSFKRDGDDSSWLLTLQKRRVSELFATDIPPDEALLTKNGRIACLVCTHRPVFDTISMLAVHRNGKKHIANSETFYRSKRELEELKEQRRHNQYCENGIVPANSMKEHLIVEPKHPLLVSTEYSSRIKHRKVKPYERKMVVSLESSEIDQINTAAAAAAAASAAAAAAADDVKCVETLRCYKTPTASMNLSHYPKCVQESNSCSGYQRESNNSRSVDAGISFTSNRDCVLSSKCRPTAQTKKSSYLDMKHWSSDGGNAAAYHRRKLEKEALVKLSSHKTSQVTSNVRNDYNSEVSLSNQIPVHETSTLVRQSIQKGRVKCETLAVGVDHKSAEPPTERSKLYLQAISNGWKKSNDGSWVKDDNAEFDSDDETPTIV